MKLTEENLKGKIFNRWQVIRYSHKVGYAKYFVCKCLDCGQEKTVCVQNITSGKSKSCGCISKKETAYNMNKKYNEWYVEDNIVHIKTDDEKEILCDLEDWERFPSSYYWRDLGHGYAGTTVDYKDISMHRLIMNVDDPKIQVDHINGNKFDNRKENLRLCTNQENSFNKFKNKNNTSGYKGVHWDKERLKWVASIQFNGKHYSKRFDNKDEAQKWYKQQSEELFKEFSVFSSRNCEIA